MIKKIISFACLFHCLSYFSQADSSSTADLSDTLNRAPVFSISGADAESGIGQQDVSSLLQSSKDVFNQFAGFQFGAARYRVRGYAAGNQMVMINGINVNNAETGFSSWSSWGGLNDVTRFVENRFGNTGSRYGFTGVGGYINIDSKASSFKKGTRISYANGNMVFRNRVMVTHSTGMMKNGWAFTFSASSRTGNQVYIPGTYINASAFYMAVDKRIGDKHLLSFTGFTAPVEQGLSAAEQLEAYTLAGTHYYNSLWGYQAGKVRNSAVNKTNQPMFLLSDTWQISTNERLTSSAYFNTGKTSVSGLNWNDAAYPRPDYYYYLPSYYYNKGDVANGNLLTDKWHRNVNTRQVNWDQLIAMNQANLYTLPSQAGQGINTTETRARYIVENKIESLKNIGINTVYNKRYRNLFLSIGANGNIYRNRKYKEMGDLLGATYWLDYDQFAQNLGVDHSYQQNDIAHPDKKILKGDRFGYDYLIAINHAEAWAQAEQSFKKLDVYAALSLSGSSTWREGFVANGKFTNSSKGSSDKLNFLNYGLKAGATYKLSGRQFITANGAYLTRAPGVDNIFLSPRTRNQYVNGLKNEEIISADLNYIVNLPAFRLRLSAYYTQTNNQVWLRTYYNDIYSNNVNLVMKNIDQVNQGLELGIEKIFFVSHVLQGTFGYGQFLYTNRPSLEAWQDNNSTALFKDRTVYLKNYRTGFTPQLVTGLGYKYNAKQHWSAGLYFNYFDEIYVEPNPDRRTREALAGYLSNETKQYQDVIKQQKLPSYFVVNANAAKSFRVMKKYAMNINLSVNNLLNNKNNIVAGYEQLRWDPANINKFANKYSYMAGITYMAMINFNF